MIKWGNPAGLAFLIAAEFILLISFWFYFRYKNRLLSRLIDSSLLSDMIPSFSRSKTYMKAGIILAVVLFVSFAFMRPQWGFRWEKVNRIGLDILFCVDTSNSMAAEDIKPSRLIRSKMAIEEFIKDLNGDRVGLIAFSGKAFLHCPLTVDYGGFSLALKSLSLASIPRGGSSIAEAIRTGIDSFEGGLKKYKVLIIISDGEQLEGDALEIAKRAKEEGIRIYCIGVGTLEGELIPIIDSSGKKTFLKDSGGQVVKTRLNETLLQKVALETQGGYVRATSLDFGLNLLYNKQIDKLEKKEIEEKMKKRFYDRFQIPLLVGLILLLIEPLITERRI